MIKEDVCNVDGCASKPCFLMSYVSFRRLESEKFYCDDHARQLLPDMGFNQLIKSELNKLLNSSTQLELELVVYADFGEDQSAALYLRQINGPRRICMRIDSCAWSAIMRQLRTGYDGPPLIHNSYVDTIKLLNAEIVTALISGQHDNFWCTSISIKCGEIILQQNVRASDAVILALIADKPVFISNSALEEYAI